MAKNKVLSLSRKFKGLDGKEGDQSLGKIMAPVLASQTHGDALKMYSWALKLYNDEELNLDPSDMEVFKSFVKDNDQMTVILKAQILEAINEAE